MDKMPDRKNKTKPMFIGLRGVTGRAKPSSRPHTCDSGYSASPVEDETGRRPLHPPTSFTTPLPPPSPTAATQTTPSIQHRPVGGGGAMASIVREISVEEVFYSLESQSSSGSDAATNEDDLGLPEPRKSRSKSLPEVAFKQMRWVHFGRQLRFAGDDFDKMKQGDMSARPSSYPRVAVHNRTCRMQAASSSHTVDTPEDDVNDDDDDNVAASSWSSSSLYDVWSKLWTMHEELRDEEQNQENDDNDDETNDDLTSH